jgi:tetratricopeptide (TPR) repeat protein
VVGWLWYVGMLVPVIGLIQVGGQAYADRYTYLPVIGLAVALVWCVGDLVGGSRSARAAVTGVSVAVLAALSVATVRQVAIWKDNRTLFSHTLAVTRDNPIAQLCLGDVSRQEGDVRLAMSHYQAAVRLVPGWAEARNKLGGAVLMALSVASVPQVALWRDPRTPFEHALPGTRDDPVANEKLGELLITEGNPQPAIEHFEAVLRIRPDLAEAHVNLAIALNATGHYDEAIGHFRIGLRSRGTANGHSQFGFALAKSGRLDEAIVAYETALRIEPDRLGTLVQLGTTLAARGRFGEAATAWRRALELNPADLETRRLIAVAALRQGQVGDAVAAYRELLRRSPDDLDALNNLAWILATHADPARRDGAEAVRLAERARDRSPEPVAVIFSTLAAAYAEAGRFPEAVSACERAIELARRERQVEEVRRYEDQSRCYRAGRAFHFAK